MKVAKLHRNSIIMNHKLLKRIIELSNKNIPFCTISQIDKDDVEVITANECDDPIKNKHINIALKEDQLKIVLFEKQGRDPGQLIGKSENLHAVHAFADKSLIGTVRRVRIIKSLTNSLTGELI